MRLTTFLAPGDSEPRAGEIRGGEAVAFSEGSVLDRLASGLREPAGGPSWPAEEVRLLAPVPAPGQIYCVGLNYSEHAVEGGFELPEAPEIFMKPASSSTAPGGPVVCPAVVRRLDYEGELAAVIGRDGEVAGYAVADDVSARDLQRREGHWTRAKGARSFCPWGPWVTTVDEVADPGGLALRTWVNGELRQSASTSQMSFGVDEVVSFLSETCWLQPGDVILTGTPPGAGFAMDPPRFLAGGDRVRVEIEGLGSIEHEIRAASSGG